MKHSEIEKKHSEFKAQCAMWLVVEPCTLKAFAFRSLGAYILHKIAV